MLVMKPAIEAFRGRLRGLVDDYKTRTGATNASIASACGVNSSTVTRWLERGGLNDTNALRLGRLIAPVFGYDEKFLIQELRAAKDQALAQEEICTPCTEGHRLDEISRQLNVLLRGMDVLLRREGCELPGDGPLEDGGTNKGTTR